MMEPMAPEFQFFGGPDFATQAPLDDTFAGVGDVTQNPVGKAARLACQRDDPKIAEQFPIGNGFHGHEAPMVRKEQGFGDRSGCQQRGGGFKQ